MLSIIIITKNEAHNIRRCLESVRFADEIIVLDSGSTDETIEIAKTYTDKVYSTADNEWQGYGVQKQRALDYATGDWVLNLDADEEVSALFKEAMLQAIRNDVADAFSVHLQMYFYGKAMRYSASPTRHIRLFKREGARYSEDIVHEKIILSLGSRVGQLNEPISHYCYQDISHLLNKLNRYSSSSAKIRIQQGKSASLFKTFVGSWWMFFRCYFIQRGFLDGREGFLLAICNAHGTFYRGVKQIYTDTNH